MLNYLQNKLSFHPKTTEMLDADHREKKPDNKSKQLSSEQREKILKILGLEPN